MANGTPTPQGGSVQQTANVSMPLTTGLVIAMWAVKPSWPPPQEVLILVVGYIAPIAHMLGRAAYRKIAAWTGEEDPAAPVTPQPQTLAGAQ